MINEDEAARSAGEEAKETERVQEKLGLREGRKAGPVRRGGRGYWRDRGGGTAGTGEAAGAAEAGVHWCLQCVQ